MDKEKSGTPMQRQYNELKKDAADCILFFRLGDFYEMFGDDAVEASEILDIVLTTRNKKTPNATPMCGIPAKSYERYLSKLIKAGKKVAIAEQVSDPSEPGIVQRKITRIITPGTTFSETILEDKTANYLSSFYSNETEDKFCLTFCEITTGKSFCIPLFSLEETVREVQKYSPAELLFTPEQFRKFSSYFQGCVISCSRHFLPENGEKFLCEFFKTKTLKSFGIADQPVCIYSASLLFSFLEDTQKTDISHLSGVSVLDTSKKMPIDSETIKNLELFFGSDGKKQTGLFHLIDETKTAMGGRKLQERFLSPLKDQKEIEDHYKKISALLDEPFLLKEIQSLLAKIFDIERIIARITTKRSRPRDFIALKKSIFSLKQIYDLLKKYDLPELKKVVLDIEKVLFSGD